jgi:hypothetical protein
MSEYIFGSFIYQVFERFYLVEYLKKIAKKSLINECRLKYMKGKGADDEKSTRHTHTHTHTLPQLIIAHD